MKLYEACDLADSCGLPTVKEAFNNVIYHLLNLFPYEQMPKEMDELKADYDLVEDKSMSIYDYMKEHDK